MLENVIRRLFCRIFWKLKKNVKKLCDFYAKWNFVLYEKKTIDSECVVCKKMKIYLSPRGQTKPKLVKIRKFSDAEFIRIFYLIDFNCLKNFKYVILIDSNWIIWVDATIHKKFPTYYDYRNKNDIPMTHVRFL